MTVSKRENHSDGKQSVIARNWERRKGELFNGNGVSVLPDEKSSGVWLYKV